VKIIDVYVGHNVAYEPRELQKKYQKEELPNTACQEKPSLRAFLACIMEDQVGESLG